jgi:hypothetical protein
MVSATVQIVGFDGDALAAALRDQQAASLASGEVS